MADVKNVDVWNKRIDTFRKFAYSVDAEFTIRRFADGKEVVVVEQYFKPKENRDGTGSKET